MKTKFKILARHNMKALDLFCEAGGTSMGLHRAGFDVIGVDIEPQPRYPFEFVQGDALEYVAKHGHKYDLIVAGPPYQMYVGPTRKALQATSKPYIIEAVPGVPLINPLILCGTMFPELRVRRHRLFECWPVIWFPPAMCSAMCYHWGTRPLADAVKAQAIGIDWMTKAELSQAIPPAYTEWLGREMLRLI